MGQVGNKRFFDVSPATWGLLGWGLGQMVAGSFWHHCHEAQVWEMEPLAILSSPLQDFVSSDTVHFLWPRIWRLKFQSPAYWIWLGQNKKHLTRQQCLLAAIMVEFTGDHPHGLDPCCIYMPTACPVPLREGNAPQGSLLSVFLLSLCLFHGQLIWGLSHGAEHPLTQIACDSQHLHHMYWESWLSLGTEANILIRKDND